MSDINDRENREYPERLAQTVVYRAKLAMAPQSFRAGIQRYERSDAAPAL